MAYSIVGLLAVFVHLIINVDVFVEFKNKARFHGEKFYAIFLLCVIAYHITDACWGFLYEAKLTTAVYIDTTIYFVAMAASILFWGIFIYHYLGKKDKANKTILITGVAIFAIQTIVTIVNLFTSVLFSLSSDCVYKAEPARYVMLAVQMLNYLLISIYTFVSALREKESARRRLFTVSLFGLLMTIAVTLQALFPLLPLYSIGFLFGICFLHTFVIRDEMVNRLHELNEAKQRVMIDPLTGTYSKHAYVDAEEKIENAINENAISEFAMVVFDINDLKATNDAYGHKEGDAYIRECTALIQEYFKDVPIYRVGGDEFAAILLGEHFQNREETIRAFDERIEKNLENHNRVLVAVGHADFIPDRDTTILQVFTRADRQMYARKQSLKTMQKVEKARKTVGL